MPVPKIRETRSAGATDQGEHRGGDSACASEHPGTKRETDCGLPCAADQSGARGVCAGYRQNRVQNGGFKMKLK